MSTRQTRAASRRAESNEPQETLVTRRTRRSSKRAEISRPDIPQRGIRRSSRRSLESIATRDTPSTSAATTPEHPMSLRRIDESEMVANVTAAAAPAKLDSQNDSDEDVAARLQDMLDFDLPKLHRWCEKAYEALSSLPSTDPPPEARKNITAIGKSFKMARRPLAGDDAAYIDVFSSNAPYQHDPSASATIQKGAHSANLISLLLSLIDVKISRKAILPFLQELDHAFTNLNFNLPASSEIHDLTFRIRCRCLVELLRQERGTAPLVLASAVFCDQPARTLEQAQQCTSQGPFRKFASMEEGVDITSLAHFKTQTDEILARLSLPKRAQIEDSLNAEFPRDKLLEELWNWALNMYVHVNKITKESDAPPNDHKGGDTNQGTARDEPELVLSNENDQLEEEEEDAPDSDSSSEMEYNTLQMLSKEQSFIQNKDTLHAVRQSEAGLSRRSTIEKPADQQSGRETRTESPTTVDAVRRLDPAAILGSPSPNRVYSSRSATPVTDHSYSSSLPHSNSQRPQENHEQDDDEFEVNEQLVDESMRVWYDADTPRLARKRPRFSEDPRQRSGRGPLQDDRAGTNIRDRDLATLSRIARTNRMTNRARPRQTREKWSDVDTDRLLDLIADPSLSCSWSVMEKEAAFQCPRNQQAIRDKARNLKKGYLCADAILPSGFDNVYLSKKERDEVIASGRNPDRMEDDINKDGHVTNNLWLEESS
ncbi:hypothetical protein GGS21DRAFT_521270 [Xylaria nigripes]|nr:hypothetical protein GGS21DRAFT_521270 [Xylaria nigripes]